MEEMGTSYPAVVLESNSGRFNSSNVVLSESPLAGMLAHSSSMTDTPRTRVFKTGTGDNRMSDTTCQS